ncbi:MAG: hypothetical protein R2873_13320 [Caldilineaceae bacterium]
MATQRRRRQHLHLPRSAAHPAPATYIVLYLDGQGDYRQRLRRPDVIELHAAGAGKTSSTEVDRLSSAAPSTTTTLVDFVAYGDFR